MLPVYLCFIQLACGGVDDLNTDVSGLGGPPGQGYPPSYPPAQRPPGHEGYGGGPPGAPGYNNYPGQGPPPSWRGQYDQGSGPPTTGNDMYNRGWGGSGYPPRPGYPQGGPPTTSSGTPPPSSYPPTSQPYDQYQVGRQTLHSLFCVIFAPLSLTALHSPKLVFSLLNLSFERKKVAIIL